MSHRTLIPILLAALAACGLDDEPLMTEPEARLVAAGDRCRLIEPDAEVMRLLNSLSATVAEQRAAEHLNAGQAVALERHVENARRAVAGAHYCVGVNQINVFRGQVTAWRLAGVLNDRQAHPLLGAVRLFFEPPAPMAVGAESYAPGVAGEIRTVTRDGSALTYQVIDGLAIYQGDIILGFADEFEAAAGAAAATGHADATQSAICPFSFLCSDWPQMTIRYRIAFDWRDLATNLMMEARILEAIAHWEARTPLRFVNGGSGPTITFRNGMGCSAGIGRMIFTGTDGQNVNLSTRCDVGAIIHEIGHTAGLWHEHSRSDRNDYVTVRTNLVQEGQVANFLLIPSWVARTVGPYDYGSIMHYDCIAFLRPGLFGNTVEPSRPGYDCSDIGQRSTLSAGDLRGVYELYPPFFRITGSTIPDFRFDLAVEFLGNGVSGEYIVWRSNRVTGELGRGLTLSIGPGDLPSGPNIIDAAIVYEGIPVFSATTLVEVFDPIRITSPADGSSYLGRAENVHFNAVVNPGVISPTVEWTTTWFDRDGYERRWVIGAGTSFSRNNLPYGRNNITATVTDSRGFSASRSLQVRIRNEPPVVEIVQPRDGDICVGEAVTVVGDATDPNGPGSPEFYWSWYLDGTSFGGAFGQRAEAAFTAPGRWLISLLVIDDGGSRVSESVTGNVVHCGNQPPAVRITTPGTDTTPYDPAFAHDGFDAALGLFYKDVLLEGEAIDPEDGPLTGAALVWTAPRGAKAVPPFGTGERVTTRLYSPSCSGRWHNIHLTAEDSGGQKRTAVRRIFIGDVC